MTSESSRISVVVPDQVVVINGEGYRCDFAAPSGLHALHWHPGRAPRGDREMVPDWWTESDFVEGRPPSSDFDDFGILAPYISAWKVAKAAADKTRAEHTEKVEAHNAEIAKQVAAAKEREAALVKRQADLKPLSDALNALGDSDHEVIKAMEAKLAEDGLLPADLVTRRRALRALAKAEKTKWGGKV